MIFVLIFICLNVFCGTNADWVQVWSDEFNGAALSDSEWNYEVGGTGWGNNELEYYTEHRKENARTEDGHLVIDVKVEPFSGKQFTSARLTSKKAWTYGKFEARAKLPKGKHLWPAIWMMPQDSKYGGWAASGEIDIMEAKGEVDGVVQGTIHYGGAWPNNVYHGSGEKNFGVDFSKDFHIFSLEWDKTTIKWAVDGKEYHSENINKNMWSGKGTNPYDHNGAPFDQSFHWILNIAVGGNFFGNDINVSPAEAKNWAKPTMEIDYLRVYQQK